MPSVDDLVISLRIDEGSNLAQLKKQLDAIVNPKTGQLSVGGGISPQLERTMNWMKDRMIYLTPETTPNDPIGIKAMAASMVKQLRDFPAIGAGIAARTGMPADYIQELERKLLLITEGILGGRKAQNLIKMIGIAIKESMRPEGEGWGKTIISMIERASVEAQAVMVKAFKDAGYEIAEFLQAYLIKPGVIEENKDKIDEFLAEMLKNTEGAKAEYDTLQKDIDKINWEDPISALKQMSELAGVPFTRDLFKTLETFKDIKDPKLAAMYVTYTEQIIKNLSPLLETFYKTLKEGTGLGVGFAGRRMKVSDITLIGGDLEKIKGLITGMDEEVKEKIDYVNMELEKILDMKELRQLEESAKFFGPTISFATYMGKHIQRAVEEVPKIGVIQKSVYGFLDILGQTEDISKKLENLEKILEDKDLGAKAMTDNVVDGLAKLMKEQKMTSSDTKTFFEGILMDAAEKVLKSEREAKKAEKPTE